MFCHDRNEKKYLKNIISLKIYLICKEYIPAMKTHKIFVILFRGTCHALTLKYQISKINIFTAWSFW